jgi:hypothetical protein
MSYQSALKAAGAKVIDTLYTGSYQGTWGSIVEYNGKKGLVIGSYGSCSHCDAFKSEFDSCCYGRNNIEYDESTGKYTKDYGDVECTKEEYEAQEEVMNKRLADFGKRYLTVIQDEWDVQNKLNVYDNKSEDDWFDNEEIQLYTWAIKHLKP